VDEISGALNITQMHMIELLAKMLLRLQHLKPNGLELRNDRLDFKGEVPAHRKKEVEEFMFGGLERSRSSKDEALLTGSNDLSAVLEHKDKLKRSERARLTHAPER
jgi:hypothetical protein